MTEDDILETLLQAEQISQGQYPWCNHQNAEELEDRGFVEFLSSDRFVLTKRGRAELARLLSQSN